jgi:hypothetical protein
MAARRSWELAATKHAAQRSYVRLFRSWPAGPRGPKARPASRCAAPSRAPGSAARRGACSRPSVAAGRGRGSGRRRPGCRRTPPARNHQTWRPCSAICPHASSRFCGCSLPVSRMARSPSDLYWVNRRSRRTWLGYSPSWSSGIASKRSSSPTNPDSSDPDPESGGRSRPPVRRRRSLPPPRGARQLRARRRRCAPSGCS